MKTRATKIGAALLGCYGALHAAGLSTTTTLLAGDTGGERRAFAELAAARGKEALNLARADLGTRLEIAGAAADAAAMDALLRDDDPLGYRLPAGTTSMILSLPRIEVLRRFNFINLTAGGKVTVALSSTKLPADSPQWQSAGTSQEFSPDGNEVVRCDLPNAEARYVKLTFDVSTAGSIDTFGLFGVPTLASDTAAHRVAVKDAAGAPGGDRALLYNYAVASDRAGVIMVSPGESLTEAQKMADGDVGTSFAFRADDPRPLAVVDLGESRPVSRVSMSFKAGPGHLDVYLLPDPAGRSNAVRRASNGGTAETGARSIQEVVAGNFPGDLQPIISTATGAQPGLNRVNGNANEQVGRYLVMVYKPANAPAQTAAAGVDFKDSKDSRDFKDTGASAAPATATNAQSLEVSELGVFGRIPPGTYTYQNIPPFLPSVPNTPGGGAIIPPPPVLPPSSGTTTITP